MNLASLSLDHGDVVAIVSGFVNLLIGGFVGARVQVASYRRGEYNAVALRLREAVRRGLSDGRISRFDGPDWDLYLHLAGGRRRRRSEQALDAYRKAVREEETATPSGHREFKNLSRVRSAVEALLDALALR